MKIKQGYTYKTRNGTIVQQVAEDYDSVTCKFTPTINGVDSWWTSLGIDCKNNEHPSDAIEELYGPIPAGYMIVTKDEQKYTIKSTIKDLKYWNDDKEEWSDVEMSNWLDNLYYIKPITPIANDCVKEKEINSIWKQGDVVFNVEQREFYEFISIYKGIIYLAELTGFDAHNHIPYDPIELIDNYVLVSTLKEIDLDGAIYLLYYKDGQPWLIKKP